MTNYVAFLHGINAGLNAWMEDLRRTFNDLGFARVQTVISSGNVLFETSSDNVSSLEQRIEEELDKKLGLKLAVNVRSEEELKALAARNPFKSIEIRPEINQYVTFLKEEPKTNLRFPLEHPDIGHSILWVSQRTIISVVDLSKGITPDLMAVLDKESGRRSPHDHGIPSSGCSRNGQNSAIPMIANDPRI
jgi:hypothetical protein